MAKPRTHANAPRTKTVTIRLTPDEHLRRSIEARKSGLSVSGLCERLVTQGKVEAAAGGPLLMDPALFAEVRRIGNNANQIAHALNSNLPPDVQFAWRTARDLLQLIASQEMLLQRAAGEGPRPGKSDPETAYIQQIAKARGTGRRASVPPPAQARHIFQRSVQVHPARRGQRE